MAVGLADLDDFDADAELAVGLLGQVGVSLRPDPRDVRPRRGQVLGPLDDVGHDRRSAGQRRASQESVTLDRVTSDTSRGPRLVIRCPRNK